MCGFLGGVVGGGGGGIVLIMYTVQKGNSTVIMLYFMEVFNSKYHLYLYLATRYVFLLVCLLITIKL